MELKRDDNRITVAGGKANNAGGLTMPLLVDPVTGRLLIMITPSTLTTPDAMPDSKFDENKVTTGTVTDGTNLKPLIIDTNTGLLSCDVLVE